jgi:hypothetical protein
MIPIAKQVTDIMSKAKTRKDKKTRKDRFTAKQHAAVEARINKLYKVNKNITPDDVINDAKNPESPLHECFNWNIGIAALEHWRDTARALIRSVTIKVTVESHVLASPRYIHSPDVAAHEQSYVDVTELKTKPKLAKEALTYEIELMESIIERVKSIAVSLGLENEINNISKSIAKIYQKIAV